MVDGMRSSVPGRGLGALGRGDVPAAMVDPSAPVRRREADGRRGPAPAPVATASPPPPQPPSSENLLVRFGLLSPEQVDDALRDQSTSGKHVAQIAVERGWVTREQLAQLVAQPGAPTTPPAPEPAPAPVAPPVLETAPQPEPEPDPEPEPVP